MKKKKVPVPVWLDFDKLKTPEQIEKTIIIHGNIMPTDIIEACQYVKEGWILSSLNTEANKELIHTMNYIKFLE